MTDKANSIQDLAALIGMNQLLIKDLYAEFLLRSPDPIETLDRSQKRVLGAMMNLGVEMPAEKAGLFFESMREALNETDSNNSAQ